MPLKREHAAEVAKQLAAKGYSKDMINLTLDQLGGVEPTAEATQTARRGIAKGLDYPGSVVRAGVVAPAIEAATGKDLNVDFGKVLRGETGTPGTAELLKRGGVGKMGSLSDVLPFAEKGAKDVPWYQPRAEGPLDFTGRGAVGFVTDMGTDPLTYATAGTGRAAKGLAEAGLNKTAGAVSALGRPLSTTLEKVGEGAYRLGVMPAEREAVKYGKEGLAKTLMEEGIYARPGNPISSQMDEFGKRLLEENQGLQRLSIGAGGSEAQMQNVAAPFFNEAKGLRAMAVSKEANPELWARADALEARGNELLKMNPQYAQTPIERVAPKTVELPQLPAQSSTVTPVEKVAPQIETINALPTQGAQMTPIDYAAAKTETVNLPTQSGQVTPVQSIPEQISTTTLSVPDYQKPGFMGLPETGPQPPVHIRQAPRMERAGNSLNIPGIDLGPTEIRTPPSVQKAGPTVDLPGIDLGPTQVRTPSRYVKAGPTQELPFVFEDGPLTAREPGRYQAAGPVQYGDAPRSMGRATSVLSIPPEDLAKMDTKNVNPFAQAYDPTPGANIQNLEFLKTRANEKLAQNAWAPGSVSDLDTQLAKIEGQAARNESLGILKRQEEQGLIPQGTAAQYEQNNAKLGSILTSQDKQVAHEAALAKKSPVSGTKLAVGAANPVSGLMLLGGQALEKGLTPIGYGINWLGKPGPYIPAPLNEATWRQIILNNERPEGL